MRKRTQQSHPKVRPLRVSSVNPNWGKVESQLKGEAKKFHLTPGTKRYNQFVYGNLYTFKKSVCKATGRATPKVPRQIRGKARPHTQAKVSIGARLKKSEKFKLAARIGRFLGYKAKEKIAKEIRASPEGRKLGKKLGKIKAEFSRINGTPKVKFF